MIKENNIDQAPKWTSIKIKCGALIDYNILKNENLKINLTLDNGLILNG